MRALKFFPNLYVSMRSMRVASSNLTCSLRADRRLSFGFRVQKEAAFTAHNLSDGNETSQKLGASPPPGLDMQTNINMIMIATSGLSHESVGADIAVDAACGVACRLARGAGNFQEAATSKTATR